MRQLRFVLVGAFCAVVWMLGWAGVSAIATSCRRARPPVDAAAATPTALAGRALAPGESVRIDIPWIGANTARRARARAACSDDGFPFGRPGTHPDGYCYDCAGRVAGLRTLPDEHFEVHCVALEASPPPPTETRRPAASSTPPPSRTPAPAVTQLVMAALEIPRDARAVSGFLLWDAGRLSCKCDRYQVQFSYAGGVFAPDYEGPFPPATDPGMAGGFVWPCEPPGRPFTGQDCRATAAVYTFAYRVRDTAGWSAPRTQSYRVNWLAESCAPRARTVPFRPTP